MAEESSPLSAPPMVVEAQWGGPPKREPAGQAAPLLEQQLVAEHDADVVKAKIELIEKRGAEHDALMARLAEKRAARLVKAKKRLADEGATEAAEALDAAAARAAERVTLAREELREELNLERELEQTAAARRAEARANHLSALNQEGAVEESVRLTAQHEQEMEQIQQEMSKKKATQKEALQARLAAKRAATEEAQTAAPADGELMSEAAVADALKAAGASPEAAAEIAADQASTEREAATERDELDKRIHQEMEARLAKAQAKFDAEMTKLRQNKGLSRDHEGRMVNKKTGLHADGQTHAYNSGHEIETLHDVKGRHAPVFRGTAGLRDQRIARAQGRCDTRRERAARKSQKELHHAQAAFQRAAGSVIGTVTPEKMAKFMWEFDKIKASEDECAAVMIYADTNRNGVLDAGEIPAAIQVWKQIQQSADLLDKHAAPLADAE